MGRLLKPLLYLALYLGTFLFLALLSNFALSDTPSGKELYTVRCLSCHGLDGRGIASAAKELDVDLAKLDLSRWAVVRRSDDFLRKLLAEGHGRMPKQPGLTERETRKLIEYLRTMQKTYALKDS
jgi:mono/diheme cytochrome c family protein